LPYLRFAFCVTLKSLKLLINIPLHRIGAALRLLLELILQHYFSKSLKIYQKSLPRNDVALHSPKINYVNAAVTFL